jgi:uncharacterized protein (DUF486 family)
LRTCNTPDGVWFYICASWIEASRIRRLTSTVAQYNKDLNNKPWIITALVSWGIALLEYLLQVPANQIGDSVLSIGQLKIIQEVITLCVFVPFSLLYLKEQLRLD